MAKKNLICNTSTIIGIFDRFWNAFLFATDRAQLIVAPRHMPFRIMVNAEKKTTIEVSLPQKLHLKNWPFKAASSVNDLHIIINANETIDLEANNIIKSCVQVTYYQEMSLGLGKIIPIECIHYDYKMKPDYAHPVFHAQFCNDAIKSENTSGIETLHDFKIECHRFGQRYGHLKIPTAHMNIISVLLCLCADHIPTEKSVVCLSTLSKKIEDLNYLLPFAPALKSSINLSGSFSSLHWYNF